MADLKNLGGNSVPEKWRIDKKRISIRVDRLIVDIDMSIVKELIESVGRFCLILLDLCSTVLLLCQHFACCFCIPIIPIILLVKSTGPYT